MNERWLVGTAVGLACLLLTPGCLGKQGGPPLHFEDPNAMIVVWERDDRDAWQLPDRVLAALPIPGKSAMVADIGAGSGYFTRRLAALVPEGRVLAVEVDVAFEEHLLAHREGWGTPNIEPHLAHYDDPMLPEASIDLVFTANTYAYIRARTEYFTKVRAALSERGHLAVIDFRPDAAPPEGIAPAPEHRVDVAVAIQELGDAGFTVVREVTFLPHQWFLLLDPRGAS